MTTWKLSQPDETTEVLLDGLCEHKGHGNLCLDLHGHAAQSDGLITPLPHRFDRSPRKDAIPAHNL